MSLHGDKMRILILGYDPFLTLFLKGLIESGFHKKHELAVVNATGIRSVSKNKKKSPFKKIQHSFSKLKKLNWEKIVLTFTLRKHPDLKANLTERIFKVTSFKSILNRAPEIRSFNYSGLESLKELYKYDLMIVATFGEKIPKALFSQPKLGTVNIHPSYLPELRGGYPTYIQSYSKKFKKGVTLHRMSEGFDEGDLLLQEEYSKEESLSHHEVFVQSATSATILVNELVKTDMDALAKKQRKEDASQCRKVLKPKWALSSFTRQDDIQGYVRANCAMHQFPYTYTTYKSRLFLILELGKELKSSSNSGAFVFKHQNQFALNFYGVAYLIKKYVYMPDLKINPDNE